MVSAHMPSRFSNKQSKMEHALNWMKGVAFRQILPHVQEDGMIWLRDLLATIQLPEAAFGDTDRVV